MLDPEFIPSDVAVPELNRCHPLVRGLSQNDSSLRSSSGRGWGIALHEQKTTEGLASARLETSVVSFPE